MAAPAQESAPLRTTRESLCSDPRMSHPGPRTPIVIDGDDGRPLAVARIDLVDHDTARAALHVESGHLPAGTRTRLVDAVFDDPDVRSRRRVEVALPLGETEILDRVRQRGLIATFRAAGSTCLVEAELPPR
jgi:hypothetical protein